MSQAAGVASEKNGVKRFINIGPWIGAGVMLLLYILTQLQACAVVSTRVGNLENDVLELKSGDKNINASITTHDATIGEVNRRLGRIETILDAAPWVKKP